MKIDRTEKVFHFLEELYNLTKDGQAQLKLSSLVRQHNLSTAYYQALLQTNILVKKNNNKRMGTYEWGSVRPPNLYMANILMHKFSELKRIEKESLNNCDKLSNNPEAIQNLEYRVVPSSEIFEKLEEVKNTPPLISTIESKKKKKNCPYDGVEFIATRNNQEFCSADCRHKYHNYFANAKRQEEQLEKKSNQQQVLQVKESKNKEFSFFWGMLKFKW